MTSPEPNLDIFLEKSTFTRPMPIQDIFEGFQGASETLVLEIGFGKGHFLRNYAKACPQYYFLGIERFLQWTRHTKKRLIKDECLNVKLLCGLAQDVLRDYFENDIFDEIHVLFPDPWPKRRHHKHRILQKPYLELFHQKLKSGGALHITTDHKDYFNDAMKAFETLKPGLFKVVEKQDYPFKTNYQIKYEREGRPIYFFQANKI